MIYSPDMLDILQSAGMSSWESAVYRHMFGSHPESPFAAAPSAHP